VLAFPPDAERLLVGASRDAVDDFARTVARAQGATFGLHRFTLTQLAARLAQGALAARGLAPASTLGAEAVAARAAFEARRAGRIPTLAPVAGFPGFARALASTLGELRLAGLRVEDLAGLAPPGIDLAALLEEAQAQNVRAAVADRADLLATARDAVAAHPRTAPVGLPLLLLDLRIESRLERDFLSALAAAAPDVFATIPAGDARTRDALASLGALGVPARSPDAGSGLARLRKYLFAAEAPPAGDVGEQVRFFSAPGEGRECVEIARRVLEEARGGIPFDEMAVALRAPEVYGALLEAAFERAGIPAYFARGVKRPDPSGRAFLALLACAAEALSARRFAEYLSFAQVPDADPGGAPPAGREVWVGPEDEALGAAADAARAAAAPPPAEPEPLAAPGAPVADGALRTPWKWERLLVEAAVIGGQDRWQRRLAGLEAELRLRLGEIASEAPEAPQRAALERDLENLGHLRRFALPVIGDLAAFPKSATWGEWLARLARLAPRVLRRPERVLAVLAEIQPMAAVEEVGLGEVLEVLREPLANLREEPPRRRHGRVFVGTPEHLRGRSFAVVFVPGLAERLFPQKPREDPLLLDVHRRRLGAGLVVQDDRAYEERQLLRLAVGAARRRVHLSYPRLEMARARPRVPSFYALDVARATRGRLPNVEDLVREAEEAARARLAWPAPPDPGAAIDDLEHDLAILEPLLRGTSPERVAGRGRYLLLLNPHLARSLRSRWARWNWRQWSEHDGLVRAEGALRDLLERHRLDARPYSVSALQRYAICPYQFLLSAIHRLEPREEPAPLEQLDPLTRGQMFHRVQCEVLREMERRAILPVTPANLPQAGSVLDEVLTRIAARYADDLAPAIPRVWQDEVEAMRTDLRLWLRFVAVNDAAWEPIRFELAFGLGRGEAFDPRSLPDPVRLPTGALLHGAIDLVEREVGGRRLRVTDHKTGRNLTNRELVVQGGEVLQPLLYSLALEAATGEPVHGGRLFYCTTSGGFSERFVPLNELTRSRAREVLEVVDRGIGEGRFPPAPREGACGICDFREVCGPYEEIRSKRKQAAPLQDLFELRRMQ
jgi:RecB family exonuclease